MNESDRISHEKRQIITTSDGSKTIHFPNINESYHSIHGAFQEANHVFIEHGIKKFCETEHLSILEIGFGTGLNSILTYEFAQDKKSNVFYHGLEAYPVSDTEIKELNYKSLLKDSRLKSAYLKIHQVKWNQREQISKFFSLLKDKQKLENVQLKQNFYDIVYFDAFGPRVQKEMWEIDNLKKIIDSLKDNGFLVTYCAKGQVKRDLKTVGFTIEALPGPPGKREMTRAWKN
jgi:tRNA U34 5-methylaminomethyl-2-thiouridine-forming methyltransferase MnmC